MSIQTEQQQGQWAIVEIMGRKVVAGYITQAVQFGLPMLRIDIPATSIFPAFTQEYGAQAIYAITYVSEQVARMTAESNKANPVAVYVPDLAVGQAAMRDNDRLRERCNELRSELLRARALPSPGDPSTDPTKLDGDDDDGDAIEDDDPEF
jgi:hypothetical protein